MQVIDTPALSSTRWIKAAFQLLRQQPIAWLGLMAAWLLVSFFIMIVPFIGLSTMHLLQPAFFAGFMLACRDQEAGKPVRPAHLFAAFHLGHRTIRSLLMIGAVGLLIGTLMGLALAGIGMPLEFARDPNGLPDLQAINAAMKGKEWLVILGFFLTLLQMGIFFAFLSNFMPMILFAVMMLGSFFLAAFSLIGLILWMPILAISNYTSYQTVFRE